MNWFKDLFIRKDSQVESLPPIPEKKPNISEPVISFVETFKANPKRFKVKKINTEEKDNHRTNYYTLTDKLANLSWEFSIDHYTGALYSNCIVFNQSDYPSFLTFDEFNYIGDALRAYIGPRSNKYWEIKQKRSERDRKNSIDRQRQALKKVYCK